jgi:alcohol dehydrogenase (cytochrome c)
MPGTYDQELNTLYWGTGNASPDYDGSVRPGDDLYTSSLLAIDPDTGKLKWYFQFTPHDLYDYDGVETPVLVDTQYQGQPRKLIVEANRNGYVYVLDRTNGKFLSATQFVKTLNWAKGSMPTAVLYPVTYCRLRRGRSFAQGSRGLPTGIRPHTVRLRNCSTL